MGATAVSEDVLRSKEVRNRYTTLTVIFAALGSVTYGYCSVVISSVLAMPSFLEYMHLDTASNTTQLQGAINGLFQAGGFIGTLASSYTSDRFGRRGGIFIACVFAIVGGALQTGAAHVAMFMIARFLTGMGVGALNALIPTLQAELSPPHSRGLLVGLHGAFILIGYTSANWIGAGLYHVNNAAVQWRVTLAFQLLAPLVLAGGIFSVPESPRWLLQHGHEERAMETCKQLRASPNDPEGIFWKAEFAQIRAQWEYDQTMPSSWASLYTVPSYRKRAIIGFLTMFFGQTTGTLVIANYGPTIYAGLGYGTSDQLIINGGWITLGLVTNFLSAFIMDKTGRVNLMVVGMAGCVVALSGASATISINGSSPGKGVQSAAVFFIFLHLFFYGLCVDAATYVYGTEIWPNHLRAKGASFSVSGLFVGSLILLCAAPTAFGEIGWYYYLVMIIMTVIAIVTMLLFFPEINGLSLEQSAAKFGDHVEEISTSSDSVDEVVTAVSGSEKGGKV